MADNDNDDPAARQRARSLLEYAERQVASGQDRVTRDQEARAVLEQLIQAKLGTDDPTLAVLLDRAAHTLSWYLADGLS